MIKSNEYFGGKVKSLSVATDAGPATVGVMAAGEYEFGTSSNEKMQVITGVMQVKLSGQEWQSYKAGETFIVDANQKFLVKMDKDVSYICWYS